MSAPLFNVSLNQIKRDIQLTQIECRKRGLTHTAVWLAELKLGLDPDLLKESASLSSSSSTESLLDAMKNCYTDGIAEKERDVYDLARNYYDAREYDRAAHIIRYAESPVPRFLYYYCMYMSKEKKRLDNMTDKANLIESGQFRDLSDLMVKLRSLHSKRKLDAFCLYLYGVVLKKLDLKELAVTVLVESINAMPTLWCSYMELVPLLADKDEIYSVNIPNHWMKAIFLAHAHVELLLSDKGIKLYNELQKSGFKNSTYMVAQIGKAFHNKRSVEKAIEQYEVLQDMDPYRLDNMDIYSNLLFVKEMKKEMSELAHKAMEINKYRPETCCVIGNYYSIRSDHTKAVVYFQRALKLDPTYLSAWTLMGHEFMEIKNTNAAIQSYRKAVEVNIREYRAWYGLGQAYEILKMPSYSLYYYKIAQELRPYDSRMLVALGETYEKLEQYSNALKCYQRAYTVGDIEGMTLLKLGNLYEKLGDIESAVPVYIEFCKDERTIVDKASLCRAYITLGNYYERSGKFDEASRYAHKCLGFDDVKIEAQALLNTIKNKRNISPLSPTMEPIDPAPEVEDPSVSPSTSQPSTRSLRTSIMQMSMDMELSNGEGDDDSDTSSTDTSE
ncbi:cell division cycle protein 23 homolog [Contarinia nasturtii]|uniref:cell division cycle protein 23 homolog n=1 Tax=Contarinia nasturtii TaxID=265458 RepID=UPI0012D43A42|nr:cell division cycle protein 23 homolog [Contarinia nasturtii]